MVEWVRKVLRGKEEDEPSFSLEDAWREIEEGLEVVRDEEKRERIRRLEFSLLEWEERGDRLLLYYRKVHPRFEERTLLQPYYLRDEETVRKVKRLCFAYAKVKELSEERYERFRTL